MAEDLFAYEEKADYFSAVNNSHPIKIVIFIINDRFKIISESKGLNPLTEIYTERQTLNEPNSFIKGNLQ